MKLSDVAVEDVAWNITPLIERTAWHSAMRYAMRMRYESYVEHRSLISYCEEDTIVKALQQVSYFSVCVHDGKPHLALCTRELVEDIEDEKCVGITRRDTVDAVMSGLDWAVFESNRHLLPCSPTILKRLIRYYQPRSLDSHCPHTALTGENSTSLHSLDGVLYDQYRVMFGAMVRGGCVVTFRFEDREGHHCYYISDADGDARIYCLIDPVSLVFHESKCSAGSVDLSRPLRGFLYPEGAAKDLAIILLKGASKMNRGLGKYVAFLEL